MILEEAKVQDILQVELEVPSNKSLYSMWKLAWEQGQHFIRFLPDRDTLSDSSMGIQGIHKPATFRQRNTRYDNKPRLFCSWCTKYGGNTTVIINHL